MYGITQHLPTEGRFIRIWTFNNQVWSDTFHISPTGSVSVYNASADSWEGGENLLKISEGQANVRYVILGED